jgi:hypothetical protein
MWKHQRDWWKLNNFVKALVGGYGSGKTLIGSKRLIASSLENAPCPVAGVSPSFPLARKTMITTIRELLVGKQSILDEFEWKWNGQYHEFAINYHGRNALIQICSGERPDSLRGPNLASAWIDEPFIQDRAVFEQMIARVRHPEARLLEILLTGTPEQLNWGYDVCIGEDKDVADVGLVQADTRFNKALNPEYAERLLHALDEKTARAYVGGEFVNLATGMVYYGFDRGRNVQELGVPEGVELGAGMDFNVNPMSAAVFWRAGSHVHFIDEIELPNADTEYMCDMLRERYEDKLIDVYTDATGSARKTSAPGGKSDFTYIRNAGFRVNARNSNPKRKDRYNAVNGKLNPKEGEPTLTVEPTCVKLIKYLSTYSHELMDRQVAMSHLLDAASYPIAYLFPVSRKQVQLVKLQGM